MIWKWQFRVQGMNRMAGVIPSKQIEKTRKTLHDKTGKTESEREKRSGSYV